MSEHATPRHARSSARAAVAVAGALAALAFSPGVARATPRRTLLALVVTNNRSLDLGRPDLRYADDDGAKYDEVFRMLAGDSGDGAGDSAGGAVELLTTFDDDTARLFPASVTRARSPTRRNVEESATLLAARAEAARRAGREVDFYFVFAGHGDVDHGQGFVELADGRLGAHELASLLARVPATRAHVILDSCNSFFVLNPRKPGGRRFATPVDAAGELEARLPRVGVFLSTSSEGEVFEWSEVQSGIFSHAVRSGIAGAADTNGDGRVSYEELAGFVATAAAEVRNPLFRPTVFARGPGGRSDEPLVDLRASTAGLTLELGRGDARRLTVRDRDALAWIDVHREEGAPVTLRLPTRLAEGFTVEERGEAQGGPILVRRAFEPAHAPFPAVPAPLTLASLAPLTTLPPTGRGPQDLFRMLFVRPYGPAALALWKARVAAEPPPVLGVSRDDVARLRLLLKQSAETYRHRRTTAALVGFGVAATFVGVGAWVLTQSKTPTDTDSAIGWSMIGASAVPATLGAIGGFALGEGERVQRDFELRLARGEDTSRLVADAEKSFERLGARSRVLRRIELGAGLALALGGAVGFGASFALRQDNPIHPMLPFLFASLAVAGGVTVADSLVETPSERLARLWLEDPSRDTTPRLAVAPTRDGAVVTLAGRF